MKFKSYYKHDYYSYVMDIIDRAGHLFEGAKIVKELIEIGSEQA